jgi:hypothetical protein
MQGPGRHELQNLSRRRPVQPGSLRLVVNEPLKKQGMSNWRERTAGYLGVIVGLALLCSLFLLMTRSMTWAFDTEPRADPPHQAGSPIAVPSSIDDPAATSGRSTVPSGSVRVYECVRGGQRVFSDQPCGADASVRDVDVARMNTYSAPPPFADQPSIPPLRYPRPTAPRHAQVRPQDAECERLQKAKDAIDARARHAHTSAESEWLRERRHELEDRYWELRCLKGR